jgi:RNA polymerase sigma-70 factor, ECF subfamily
MNDEGHLEAILIARCQRGDPGAIDKLLQIHRARAYQYALKLTRHTEDAADVVSDGFLRIHRAIGRFQLTASFSTWMYKILRNCFLDMRKKRRVSVVCSIDEKRESEDGSVCMQIADGSESAFEIAAKSEYSEQVGKAVATLNARQRSLLSMYYEEDCTYSKIASLTGVPSGTIKSRLHRAKSDLRQNILGSPGLSPLAIVK